MKKLVAVTTTILIILIAVLGIFMIKGHGSDSSTAKSTLSDLKESLSDKKEDTKAAEASKDSDADWVYDGELLHMNKQMKTITYEGRDFKVKLPIRFMKKAVTTTSVSFFMIRRMDIC